MSDTLLPEVKFLGPQSFEEMDIPEILYKYRDWGNPLHRRILREREVYFASPGSFIDHYDCHIPRRFDLLTDEQILNKYRTDLKKQFPAWGAEVLEKEAKNWFNKGLLRDKDQIASLDSEFWKEFNKMFGVLSLTPVPVSKEMWIKYSSDYSGICVGFKSLILFRDSQHFGAGGPVSYYSELPILVPYQEDSIIEHQRQIYSKEEKWSFEKEYRLSKFNIRTRAVTLPLTAYSEVIIGPKIRKNNKKDIIRIVTKRLPGVVLKELYFEGEEIKIRNINF
jgi:hypothetical protein